MKHYALLREADLFPMSKIALQRTITENYLE